MSHPILLAKLNYCGERGITKDCLKRFLTDRIQFTLINGVISSNLPIFQHTESPKDLYKGHFYT